MESYEGKHVDLLLLDENFNTLCIIDDYLSVIWTDRYYEYGDTEVQVSLANESVVSNILDESKSMKDITKYLYNMNSEHIMFIESIEVVTNVETGNILTIKGRSLETILERRVLTADKQFTGTDTQTLYNCVKELLDENILNPTVTNRKISNFELASQPSDEIFKKKLTVNYSIGDNLYDVINDICSSNGVGFKITVPDLYTEKKFLFTLYNGKDSSYKQTTNPYLVFSTEYNNLLSADYIDSNQNYKNTVFVKGNKENDAYMSSWGYESTEATGLARREMFSSQDDSITGTSGTTDSTDSSSSTSKTNGYLAIGTQVYIQGKLYISSDAATNNGYVTSRMTTYITRVATGAAHPYNTTGDLGWMNEEDVTEVNITSTDYSTNQTAVTTSGVNTLKENNEDLQQYSAEMNKASQYEYKTDYNVGDIVEVVSTYVKDRQARITEYIISEDSSGYFEYPTFEIIDEEDDT